VELKLKMQWPDGITNFGDVADGVDAAAADLAWPPRLHE
jgi:hypothetical protein